MTHVGSMNSHEYKLLLGCWVGSMNSHDLCENVIFTFIRKFYARPRGFETLASMDLVVAETFTFAF